MWAGWGLCRPGRDSVASGPDTGLAFHSVLIGSHFPRPLTAQGEHRPWGPGNGGHPGEGGCQTRPRGSAPGAHCVFRVS